MTESPLHLAAERGDISAVRSALAETCEHINTLVDGFTPLMRAAANPSVPCELLTLLLDAGAQPNLAGDHFTHSDSSAVALALGAGALEKVELLVNAGANIRYSRHGGYNALLDAVHGHDVLRDPKLLMTLERLIEWGVDLNAVSTYQESGLRVLSRIGRFDAVKRLLLAGADTAQLGWTPLMRAAAIGTLEDFQAELVKKPALEETDWWSRTALLIAVVAGDIAKVDAMWAVGANMKATARCGVPALSLALEAGRLDVASYLIQRGADVDQPDEFGDTPLFVATESGNVEAIDLLIRSGAEIDTQKRDYGVMYEATERSVILRLLHAGADPADISREGMRALLGMRMEPRAADLHATPEQYLAGKHRRFGKSNPELMNDPFWLAMIHSGVDAYQAAMKYEGKRKIHMPPIWCAQRFGQSWKLLEDGRLILVAGEHEDYYDPDFCIYNDVWVQHPDGRFDIYGYPEELFPPTDFHSATLVGTQLWLIGSLGYPAQRRTGTTQVFALDLPTMKMQCIETGGDCPGWISRHRARLVDSGTIEVQGGNVCTLGGDGDGYKSLQGVYRLNIRRSVWSKVS